MNHIKTIRIKGFKKFQRLDIVLNEHMNIFVGDNEAGKSTILEAIKYVFFQQNRNADKSFLKDLFNHDEVTKFSANPCIENLPSISIEIFLVLDPKSKDSEYFYGEVNSTQKGDFGITFICSFDEELGSGIENQIKEGVIPYDYYSLRWICFSGAAYSTLRRPFGFIYIDTATDDTTGTFNYFSRSLFNSLHDDAKKLSIKNSFRTNFSNALKGVPLEVIDDNRHFGINDRRVTLESVLSVYEDEIPLENKGKGMESLIKTQIALNRKEKQLDVILMEEPENHLSYSTMHKMLKAIQAKQNNSQIIITTHSDMIASHLDLRNVFWIDEVRARSLTDIKEDDALFFTKADNNGLLELLLAKKVLLVEGATESLYIPAIYHQVTGGDINSDGIAVVSCNGISYKRYLAIAKIAQKKVAVLTDNDEKQKNIDFAKQFNAANTDQHIFMGETLQDWTWEACFYRINQAQLDRMVEIDERYDYKYKDKDYGKRLGKMLNTKVDTAYMMLSSGHKFEVPAYIKEAFRWLNES